MLAGESNCWTNVKTGCVEEWKAQARDDLWTFPPLFAWMDTGKLFLSHVRDLEAEGCDGGMGCTFPPGRIMPHQGLLR